MNLGVFFYLYQEIELRYYVTENSIVNVKILEDFITRCKLLIVSKHLVSQLNGDAENVLINRGNTLQVT